MRASMSPTMMILALIAVSATSYAQDAFVGETLISPMNSRLSHMIDMDGIILQSWEGYSRPASFAYLLEDGVILRPCVAPNGEFEGGGTGGRIQIIGAGNELIWSYDFSTYDYQQHHDVQPMPNGNVLVIAWERKTYEEAIAMGRVDISGEMWPTLIAEIEPQGASGGQVVWEWHLWDHVIQDVDPGKPNYGVVSEHPELMDINTLSVNNADWLHANAIDYDEVRDEIVFCARASSELYVIDHSTTTEEAAGHTGGARGKGGDFLYRWGNSQLYGRGTANDQTIDVAHGANWIDPELPGGGHILVFDNGDENGDSYSSVFEVDPPLDVDGNYVILPGEPFGPEEPFWNYGGPGDFEAGPRQGGAFRLPNGNTLICAVQSGRLFEVTTGGQTVWEYTYGSNIARAMRYWHDATAVNHSDAGVPVGYALRGGAPNPFNPIVSIGFVTPSAGRVQLSIHAVDGRRVVDLANSAFAAGEHTLTWNGRDETGRPVASGVYLLRMRADRFTAMERLLLLK